MLRKKVIMILAVIMLCAVSPANTVGNKDFYSSGQILPGEKWNIVKIYNDDTVVTMLGGMADFISTYDRSTLNAIYGQAGVGAYDYSIINIYGGTHWTAHASGHGIVNFSGDAVSLYLIASDFGVVNMIGGTVESLRASESGVLNLYYGQVTDYLSTWNDAFVNIFGHDLGKTNVGGKYGHGQVYGFLLDGSSFTIDFGNSEAYSHVNLIPEPSTFVLLGFSGLILRWKKEKR